MPIDQTDSGKGKFPLHWFAAAFVISLLTSVFGGWQMWQVHERFQELSDMRAHVTEDIGRIMLFDEILTMSARMAAATGEFAYETRYDQIDAQLTAVINHVKADLPQVDVARHIAATDAANLALVKLERQAFALMHQGKLQQASALLASTEYLGLKKEYAGGMKKTAAAMMAFIAGKQQRLHTQAELIAATNFGGVLVLLATWFFAIRSARSWATAQREFDEALKKSHDELEVLVKQRTAELSSANEQLQHEISEHKILFDSSHDALMLLAPPSWKFTGANKATLQLFGAASMADFTALGPWDVSPERQPDGRTSRDAAREKIERALADGSLDFAATDHAPCPREEKETGGAWTAYGGLPGVETMLPFLLDEGVRAGRTDLARLVEVTSGAAARRFGLAGRKGALQAGMDADLVLVDQDAEWTVRGEELHSKAGWTPFEGRTFRGRVMRTFVRGRLVYDAGAGITGEPGWGAFVRRDG